MNPYKVQGILIPWISSKMKEIGFANIQEIIKDNEKCLIKTKSNETYKLKIDDV